MVREQQQQQQSIACEDNHLFVIDFLAETAVAAAADCAAYDCNGDGDGNAFPHPHIKSFLRMRLPRPQLSVT